MTALPLIQAAQELNRAISPLVFSAPITHVYNPLDYAWKNYEAYLRRYGANQKRVVFLGMNPGPFGMVQTGIPFGEVAAVRDWLKLREPIDRPERENPKRPIEGLNCSRSEVSGKRLWGLFEARFGTATRFFDAHFVLNYCPLAFFAEGRNVTPDKLPAAESAPLLAACDRHLKTALEALAPEWVIGVGVWAEKRAQIASQGLDVRVGKILHPSPASPAANRGWSEAALNELMTLGVW